MKIIYSSEFKRAFKKLSNEAKLTAIKKEKIFKINPFDIRLKTHKLTGKLRDCWAFSISYSDRIIFEFGNDDIIFFHSVGSHDIYK